MILWHCWSAMCIGRESSTQGQLQDFCGSEQNQNENVRSLVEKGFCYFFLSLSLCLCLLCLSHTQKKHTHTHTVCVYSSMSRSLWHVDTCRESADPHSWLVPAPFCPEIGHIGHAEHMCLTLTLITTCVQSPSMVGG